MICMICFGVLGLLFLQNVRSVLFDGLVRVDFTPGSCIDRKIQSSNSSILSFSRELDGTSCESELGIRISSLGLLTDDNENREAALVSQQPLPLAALLPKGFSVELWTKPRLAGNEIFDFSLVSLEPTATGSPISSTNDAVCGRRDFHLLHRMDKLYLAVRITGFFASCVILETNATLVDEELTHIVAVFREDSTQMFLNGYIASESTPLPLSALRWNPNSHLHLLDTPTYNSNQFPYQGIVYSFGVYNEPWSHSQAMERFEQGPPRSRPTPIDQEVTMFEDGEVFPESHKVAWYMSPPSLNASDMAPIFLSTQWLDAEHAGLVKREHPAPSLFVVNLPARGVLYHSNGTQIENTQVPLQSTSVFFIPAFNEFSVDGEVYDQFQICASSTDRVDASTCDRATVTIRVFPVNDPPIITGPSMLDVQEGLAETLGALRLGRTRIGNSLWIDDTETLVSTFEVEGTDEDTAAGDEIASVNISRPPKFGTLKSTNGSLFVKPKSATIYVPNPNALRGQDKNGTGLLRDSFGFRLSDSYGAWSEESVATVTVHAAVYALNTSELFISRESSSTLPVPVIFQNDPSTVRLYGIDDSGWNRTLRFQIQSLPPLSVGTVFDHVTKRALIFGSILTSGENAPYGDGVEVAISPHPGYFNRPCLGECEKPVIGFRVLVLNEAGVVVSQSKTNVQRFDVVNVNTPPNVTGPALIASVSRPPFTVNATEILIRGFNVVDKDGDANRVLVNVSTTFGRLCLNRTWWQSSRRYEHVLCGDGDGCNNRVCWSNELVFSSYPSMLESALNGMVYSSFRVGADVIRLEFVDGSCLDFNGAAEQSTLGDCYKVVHEVGVMIEGIDFTPLGVDDIPNAWELLLDGRWHDVLYFTGLSAAAFCLLGSLVLYFRWRGVPEEESNGDKEKQDVSEGECDESTREDIEIQFGEVKEGSIFAKFMKWA